MAVEQRIDDLIEAGSTGSDAGKLALFKRILQTSSQKAFILHRCRFSQDDIPRPSNKL